MRQPSTLLGPGEGRPFRAASDTIAKMEAEDGWSFAVTEGLLEAGAS